MRLARRQAQLSARLAVEGRLDAALKRVEALETELRASRSEMREAEARHVAAAAQAVELARTEGEPSAALGDEIVQRLAMAAPVVEATLADAWSHDDPPGRMAPLTVRRRNAGLHCARRRAGSIAVMSGAELNRLQRGRRRLAPDAGPAAGAQRAEQESGGAPQVRLTLAPRPPAEQPDAASRDSPATPEGGGPDAAAAARPP